MYVCICMAVTDSEVRAATRDGASTLQELQEGLGVATCCGQCEGTVCELLRGNDAANAGTVSVRDAGILAT